MLMEPGSLIFLVHLLAMVGISVYGCLGFASIYLVWKARGYGQLSGVGTPSKDLPTVTIQLPLYNEKGVAARLLEAITDLDYPRKLLDIQVLDDSDDETVDCVARLVDRYRKQGWDIVHVRRLRRSGYKAGALAAGLKQAKGELVAIFDADFLPSRDFLRETVPPFGQDPRLGLVQARWTHLNATDSLITRAQSVALDKHFAVEQFVRYSANYFPKFNGSAGLWRKSCVEDAGGWSAATLCEDLCLSTRAALRGWHFLFLKNVEARAELPRQMAAYKSQQARWALGSIQCLRLYGKQIVGSPNHTLPAKIYTLLTMTGYLVSFLAILLILTLVPLVWLDFRFPPAMGFFGLAGLGQTVLFFFAQKTLYPDWAVRCLRVPWILLVSLGLAPKLVVSLLRGLTGKRVPFVRTPKGKAGTYSPEVHVSSFAEIFLFIYALGGVVGVVVRHNYPPLAFLLVCLVAFGLAVFHSLRDFLESWGRTE